MQGRGLKPETAISGENLYVAPYAGAWIETIRGAQLRNAVYLSPLMQGRGLKLVVHLFGPLVLLSPLMQGRGLKPLWACRFKSKLRRPLCRGVD